MTDGRSLPDNRALPPNEEVVALREREPNQRRSVRFGALLGGLALGLLLVSWFVRSRTVSLAVFGSGSIAAFALYQLANGESRRAHRERPHTAGRIVESRQGTAHVLFLLPGLSLEPWRADAWVLWVYSGMSAWAGNSWIGRAAGFVQVVLVGLLALRVVASARARFRIELEPGRWLVEAVVAGRSLQRTGRGALMPELTPEALLLWSESGRVAVLRWELESNERQWLSDRLTHYLETENLAAIAEQRDQVDRAEADQNRQGQ